MLYEQAWQFGQPFSIVQGKPPAVEKEVSAPTMLKKAANSCLSSSSLPVLQKVGKFLAASVIYYDQAIVKSSPTVGFMFWIRFFNPEPACGSTGTVFIQATKSL